jgi:hypothetical protein
MSHPFNRTELAPMLRVFGNHAGRMSLLVRLRPSLLPRITFAPRRAIHAIGCWFHLSPEAAEPDAYVAEVVEKTHPRNLLRSAIPHSPARLYRALDGIADDHVCDLSFYSRLKSTTLKRNRAVAEVIPFKIESAQGNRAACQRRRILTAGLTPAIRRSVAAYNAADTRLNLDLRQAEYDDAVDVEDAAIYRVAETPAGNYADIKAKARVLTVSEEHAGGGSPSFSLEALVESIMADLEQIEVFE